MHRAHNLQTRSLTRLPTLNPTLAQQGLAEPTLDPKRDKPVTQPQGIHVGTAKLPTATRSVKTLARSALQQYLTRFATLVTEADNVFRLCQNDPITRQLSTTQRGDAVT